MTKSSLSILAGVAVSTLAFSGIAYGHPGGGMGGGGMGNGGMGGMGIGGEMSTSRGADFPDRANSRATMNTGVDTPARPHATTSSSTTTLQRNSHVASALSTSLTRRGITLPAGGLNAACAGYGNLGNCISALHVAHNLNLQGGFTALKGLTTGPNAVSMGDAIKRLRPSADANAAVRTAHRQAKADIEASSE